MAEQGIRKIAFRINYDGRLFSGLVNQENTRTVGGVLLQALDGLIAGNRLHYAGRTDRGVSATGMVISFTAFSRIPQQILDEDYAVLEYFDTREYNYDAMVNRKLPRDVKVTGWTPVPPDFDARFSCIYRGYKYYFINDGLDLSRMENECKKLLLLKNFKSLCKKSEARRYRRNNWEWDDNYYNKGVMNVRLSHVSDSLWALEVESKSFLHHMVRKMHWVVEWVGLGNPSIVDRLLNGEDVECGLSPAENLIFCKAVYNENLRFLQTQNYKKILYEEWKEGRIKNEMQYLMLKE
ncbi:tRNA pseudouridine(38/39) synthase [Astathelohania contejeani]|uniref:tRNA pseudouridine synthase n=1 Tax=Astathelohania contejeani TaxID=164912 RepID=A0ABQ7I175_9MICR|nr:tRNA pseudouridine(38/39) synthase [Thelohania contejeani]